MVYWDSEIGWALINPQPDKFVKREKLLSTCRINILPHKLFQLNQSKIVSKFFFGQVINAFNRIGICQIPIFLHPIFKWLSILSNSIFLGAKTYQPWLEIVIKSKSRKCHKITFSVIKIQGLKILYNLKNSLMFKLLAFWKK